MKIYHNNTTISCEPTQEALEALNIDTYNHILLVKKDNAYLMPVSTRSGCSYSKEDKKQLTPIKISLFNVLFKKNKLKQYMKDMNTNMKIDSILLDFEIKKRNWKLEIRHY